MDHPRAKLTRSGASASGHSSSAREEQRTPASPGELGVLRKVAYASGDLANNAALAAVALVFAPFFLIEVVHLRPALAGLVPLVGRFVDAVTDPLMGKVSDATRWKWGRRRPFFVLGAIPFGLSFALLWARPPAESQAALFGYYTLAYCLLAVASTVVAVPYLALIPEMALDYDERSSLNTYRGAAAILGIFVAIGMRPLAELFGGGAAGFARAGAVMGAAFVLPWAAVVTVSFERPEHQARPASVGLWRGAVAVWRNRSFRLLVGLYLCGRVAIDLVATMLLLYLTHYIGRSRDFEPLMALFLATVVAVLPGWLWLAKRMEKSTVFVVGATWWALAQLLLYAARPSWPRWAFFVAFPATAVGYAVVDLMPWAMIGDVVDEDDLTSMERREGLYNGIFLFLRKLSGAAAVFAALGLLDLAGLRAGQPPSERTLAVVRALTCLGPAVCLAGAVAFALRYPLSRGRHRAIRSTLEARAAPGTVRAGPSQPPGSQGPVWTGPCD